MLGGCLHTVKRAPILPYWHLGLDSLIFADIS